MHELRIAPIIAAVSLALGLVGCGQSNANRALRSRLCELEVQSASLERESKKAVEARDLAMTRADTVEQEYAKLVHQLEELRLVARERDQLRQTLAQRTTERDFLQSHLTQFSRELQNLATKVEQAANQPPAGTTPVIVSSTITATRDK